MFQVPKVTYEDEPLTVRGYITAYAVAIMLLACFAVTCFNAFT